MTNFRLAEGVKMPLFEGTETTSKIITNDDFTGKTTLLSFFRYASCPLCNMWLIDLVKREELWKNDLNVVGVFHSPAEHIMKYVGRRNPPITMIADPEKKLYKAFAVENSLAGIVKAMVFRPHKVARAMSMGLFPGIIDGGLRSQPADFIIGPDLTIERVHYGKDISDHIAIDEIVKILGELKARKKG